MSQNVNNQTGFFTPKVKERLLVGTAVAGMVAGVALLALGSHAFHTYTMQNPNYHQLIHVIPGNAASHLRGVVFLGVGSVLAAAGAYVLGREGLDKAKKRFTRFKDFQEKLTEGPKWAKAKNVAKFVALTVGLVTAGACIFYLAGQGPQVTNVTTHVKFNASYAWPQTIHRSVGLLIGSSIAATWAICGFATEWFKKNSEEKIKLLRETADANRL